MARDATNEQSVTIVCNQQTPLTKSQERNGSGVELRTLDYEKLCSNPVLRC